MNDRLHDALEVCLSAMRSGVARETCLQLYPELADELRPLLRIAAVLEEAETGAASSEAIRRSRKRSLDRAAALRKSAGRFRLPAFLPRFALAGLAAVLAIVLGLGSISAAASQALPGDSLYLVKRAQEIVNLRLAPNPIQERQLTASYNQRRVSEVRGLLALERVESVAFEGRLLLEPGNLWTVGDIPVIVRAGTLVDAGLASGQIVSVAGFTRPGGWVQADMIHLRGFTLSGTIDQMAPDQWVINGQPLLIGPATLIAPGIQVGETIIALVRIESGVWVAEALLQLPDNLRSGRGTGPGAAMEPEVFDIDGDFDFTGTVGAIGAQQWTIGGRTIQITSATEIRGTIRVGDTVRTRGLVRSDGSYQAEEIRLETRGPEATSTGSGGPEPTEEDDPENENESVDKDDGEKVEFVGVLQSRSGSVWVIGGTQVTVDSDSEVKDNPQVGQMVSVEAFRQPDGSLWAKKIELEDD